MLRRLCRHKALWNCDGFRLARSKKVFTGMWIPARDRNLIAQLETVFAVTPRILDEDARVDLCVVKDLGGQATPYVVVGIKKRLKSAVGEAMNKGKDEEREGDPVEGYPQILQQDVSKAAKGRRLVAVRTHHRLGYAP